VVYWYGNLSDCYTTKYEETKEKGNDFYYFLNALKQCYGSYAYAYNSNTSVYNITLYNISTDFSSPMLERYSYLIPTGTSNEDERMSAFDWTVVAIFILIVIIGMMVLLRKVLCQRKKKTREFHSSTISRTSDLPANVIDAVENKTATAKIVDSEIELANGREASFWDHLFGRNGESLFCRDSFDIHSDSIYYRQEPASLTRPLPINYSEHDYNFLTRDDESPYAPYESPIPILMSTAKEIPVLPSTTK